MNGQNEPSPNKTSRRTKRAARRFVVLLAAVLAILGLSWVITGAIQRAAVPVSEAPPSVSASVPVASSAPDAGPDPLDPSTWNFIGPVEQTINEMQVTAPDYRMIALPENGRVDMSYFDNVTFVGDSITQGFAIFSQGIPNAHYCAYKSIGPKQVYDGSEQKNVDGTQHVPMDAIVESAPDNVYILLGTNAMIAIPEDDILVAYYSEMIDVMRSRLAPGVGIYVQSITPVRAPGDAKISNERVHTLNNMLAKMAWEKGIYFLDLNEVLAGDDGTLREDFAASDGIHLQPSGYSAWKEYLVTHTAYHPRNPYLPGSGYYLPPAPPQEDAAPPEEGA